MLPTSTRSVLGPAIFVESIWWALFWMAKLQWACKSGHDPSCSFCTFPFYLARLWTLISPSHMVDIFPFFPPTRSHLGQDLCFASLLTADYFVLLLPQHLSRRGSLPSWPLPSWPLLSFSLLVSSCYYLFFVSLPIFVSPHHFTSWSPLGFSCRAQL